MKIVITLIFTLFFISYCSKSKKPHQETVTTDSLRYPAELNLNNIKMLTKSGENAEAYFSFNENKLVYQSSHGQFACDQIFMMNLDGTEKKLISTGFGRTTCAYFYPDNETFIYASTHLTDSVCPPPPDYSKGYIWKVYASYDLYIANISDLSARALMASPGYDAEATVSPQGDKIVFTSQRNGDLDIYTMNLDGTDLQQLTYDLGYDGGAFFSWDGKKIVYRSYYPSTKDQIKRYKDLLKQQSIEPGNFQIWVMNADGSDKRQITNNKFANFAPFFHPDNKRIIFCSSLNSEDKERPVFNLWLINEDGTGLKQVSHFNGFDGFPMFSRDGKKLVFASNRFNREPRDTNIFLADWVE